MEKWTLWLHSRFFRKTCSPVTIHIQYYQVSPFEKRQAQDGVSMQAPQHLKNCMKTLT